MLNVIQKMCYQFPRRSEHELYVSMVNLSHGWLLESDGLGFIPHSLKVCDLSGSLCLNFLDCKMVTISSLVLIELLGGLNSTQNA